MRFRYKRFAPDVLRPIIPIDILFRGQSIRYEVLVDSGADGNVVPADIGELLGLNISQGREQKVDGITGGGLPFFIHPVAIRVGGWAFDVPMGFMPAMPSFGYGVVGQRGFFDLFKVTFDYDGAEIELKPYS